MDKIKTFVKKNKKTIAIASAVVLTGVAVTTTVVALRKSNLGLLFVKPDDVIIEMIDGVLTIRNPE